MTSLLFTPPALGTVLSLTGLPGGSNKIHDRSPYGNTATIVGATWVRLPSGLWCLNFDGSDDYVDCGSNSSLDITTAITLEAWVQANALDVGGSKGVFGKGSTGDSLRSSPYGMYLYYDQLFVHFSPADISTYRRGYATLATTGWFLCTAVIVPATDTILIYFNGSSQSVTKSGTATAMGINATSVKLGFSSAYWDGKLALPRIYNHALNAFDIQKHFEKEKHLFGA